MAGETISAADFLETLPSRTGSLGAVGPYQLAQLEIDIYGALIGDLDPMHNDPAWPVGQAEFGGTIAIGTQSLSRLPWVLACLGFPVRGEGGVVWRPLGLPRVRFLSPLPPGTDVVVESELESVEDTERGCRCVTSHLYRRASDDAGLLHASLVSEFELPA